MRIHSYLILRKIQVFKIKTILKFSQKRIMNKLNIIGFLLLIFISSCRKDINDVTETITPDSPIILTYTPNVNNIIGSVIGQVVDEFNNPLASIKITMNDEAYATNEYGHFFIEDATMNSLGQFIEAKRDADYFSGSRRFFPQEGETSRIKIQLARKEFTAEFSAQDNALILIEGGAQVRFKANSIKDADGNLYEGIVEVASHWLDPLATETLDKMPGNLQGVNLLSEEVALQTFGMIEIELESPSGERLNIADGQTAEITMPIPDELLAIAPEEIPLWSFNKEYGLWQAESSATLMNNTYVGKVSHFSFWNCGDPYPLVELKITYFDPNGTPLSAHLVKVELGNGITGTGYTSMNGQVVGLFPANEILTFNILDECDDIISSQNFGPFNVNTDIGTISLLTPYVNNTTIKGTLLDCNNNIITNGLIITSMNGIQSFFYIGDGDFEILLTACSGVSSIEVYGVNMDNLETSASSTITANDVNDLGDMYVCGNGGLQDYIRVIYNVDTTLLFTNAVSNINSGSTVIEGSGTNASALFHFTGTTIGDYSNNNNNFFESLENQIFGIDLQPINSSMSGFESFIVTQYDTKLIGTFSGPAINNNTGALVQIQGDFNINQ